MNTVEIDEAAMAAELDAAFAQTPPPAPLPDAAPGAQLSVASPADEWVLLTTNLVPVVSTLALPQWNLTAEENAELGQSMGLCLAQLFPDGLNGKYACWFRLAACTGMIAVSRYSQHGKLPGFGPKKPEPPAPADSVPAKAA